MLQLADTLPNAQRMDAFLAGYVAWDVQAGIHLHVSHGRRRPGRPARYWVWGRGRNQTLWQGTAYSDAEAVDKANTALRLRPDVEAPNA